MPEVFFSGINESASADDADGVEHGKVKGERGHIHGELMSHVVSFSQVQLHWTIHPQQNFKVGCVKHIFSIPKINISQLMPICFAWISSVFRAQILMMLNSSRCSSFVQSVTHCIDCRCGYEGEA